MSNYESNPAGLGVSQRYGAQELGGVGGVTCSADGKFIFVGEVSAEELAASPVISFEIPEGYALIDRVFVEVEEGFGAGDTLDVLLDGTTVLAAPLSVATAGVVVGTLTSDPTPVDAGEPITVDVSLVDSGSTTGYAKVSVELTRV